MGHGETAPPPAGDGACSRRRRRRLAASGLALRAFGGIALALRPWRARGAVVGAFPLALAMVLAPGPGAIDLSFAERAPAWAQAASPAPAFPAPDRPVAPIVTYQFSDERTRDQHGEARRVLDRLDVKPGVRVADIGAGGGYYTVRLARRLGPGATVYAEDVKAEYLARLGERLRREHVAGVTLVRGEPRDPKLPPASIDLAILGHMYHEIENPFEFLYHLHGALAPGARVAIVDTDRPTGSHGTPPALLRCELAAVGYRQVDFVSLAPAEGYLAVFVPPVTLPPVPSIRPCPQ